MHYLYSDEIENRGKSEAMFFFLSMFLFLPFQQSQCFAAGKFTEQFRITYLTDNISSVVSKKRKKGSCPKQTKANALRNERSLIDIQHKQDKSHNKSLCKCFKDYDAICLPWYLKSMPYFLPYHSIHHAFIPYGALKQSTHIHYRFSFIFQRHLKSHWS